MAVRQVRRRTQREREKASPTSKERPGELTEPVYYVLGDILSTRGEKLNCSPLSLWATGGNPEADFIHLNYKVTREHHKMATCTWWLEEG